MVSNPKRSRYVSDFSSSDDDDYSQQSKRDPTSGRRSSKPKWLSKNAIMARENRLKKKLYLTNLENQVGTLKTENANISKILKNQSLLITDLKKEIKYLKSVIANSADISNLIKNIHSNTGMLVTTSSDQTLSNAYVPKPKPIARKTAHPWEEKRYPSFPTPESDFLSSPQSESGLNDFLTDDLFNNIELDDILEVSNSIVDPPHQDTSESLHLQEHNYTSVVEDDEEVGVCLHVSKHRVSVEFCSSCSENASQAWKD